MSNAILVVGGGFSGLTAAIEAAELGHDVYIVEKSPWLGGRVAQLNKYFPKLCPPPAAWKSSSSASGKTRASNA